MRYLWSVRVVSMENDERRYRKFYHVIAEDAGRAYDIADSLMRNEFDAIERRDMLIEEIRMGERVDGGEQ